MCLILLKAAQAVQTSWPCSTWGPLGRVWLVYCGTWPDLNLFGVFVECCIKSKKFSMLKDALDAAYVCSAVHLLLMPFWLPAIQADHLLKLTSFCIVP